MTPGIGVDGPSVYEVLCDAVLRLSCLVFVGFGRWNLTPLRGRVNSCTLQFLYSVEGVGGAYRHPVTLQGAMLLLCDGTTQMRHEDRVVDSESNAWIYVPHHEDHSLEHGMQCTVFNSWDLDTTTLSG